MLRVPFLLAVPCFLALAAHADPFTTEGERSEFRRTGRYEEVERLCAAAAAADARRVRCFTFGRTPEGRNMVALAVSGEGTLDGAKARSKTRPVLLIQGGIHAGEIEGKDAIFLCLRELLAGRMAKGVLDAATLVLVPVFNVDGHERFGPANRPNQRGPEEMGYRATAQNLNLNRDYVKADFEKRVRDDPAFAASPEARLELIYRRLPAWEEVHEWVPVLRVASAAALTLR